MEDMVDMTNDMMFDQEQIQRTTILEDQPAERVPSKSNDVKK